MTLDTRPVLQNLDLVAESVAHAIAELPARLAETIGVAEIDPGLSDTAAFCAAYGEPLTESANCLVVVGKRGGVVSYSACLVFADTRADINGVVRRLMDVRKASFAATDDAVALTAMEFGGITPIGLPAGWPIYLDSPVAAAPRVVIGGGGRSVKLVLPGATLAQIEGARVIDGLATPIA